MEKTSHPQGLALIISGPSGVGKGTVIQSLRDNDPTLELAISHTTRKPRLNEVDGIHYHFMPIAKFKHKAAQGEFLEWAPVHGNFYGTGNEYFEILKLNRQIIFEVDVQGAKSLIRIFKEKSYPVISVFLLPPSMEELQERLIQRSTETNDSYRIRCDNARLELEEKIYFDYHVINDKIDATVSTIQTIIKHHRSI